jgi:hypothetical protein
MRYIARRYLAADNGGERSWIAQLTAEVAKLSGHSLSRKEIEGLIRATVTAVRARLFQQDTQNPAGAEAATEVLKEILQRGHPRLWPFLLILEPVQTVMLLKCIAGIVPSAPPRGRWFRRAACACTPLDNATQPIALELKANGHAQTSPKIKSRTQIKLGAGARGSSNGSLRSPSLRLATPRLRNLFFGQPQTGPV